MDGVIQGGWEWVIAAWGISLAVFATYALLLQMRIKGSRPRDAQDAEDRR